MHPFYARQQRAMVMRPRGGVPSGGDYYPGGNGGHGGNGAGISPDVVALIQALRGGSVGEGLGCTPRPAPAVPMGPNGCPQGSLQCKQDIGINSGVIVAGVTATFNVLPRSFAQPRSLIYTGPVGQFTINSALINGTDYLAGAVNADRWLAANDVDRSLDWAQFSRNTPLILTVTNVGVGDFAFTGAVQASVDRG